MLSLIHISSDNIIAATNAKAAQYLSLIHISLALCTTGLENYAVPLGLGKWITSVTMTVFYVLLYRCV